MFRNTNRNDFPSLQIWRSSPPGSMVYNRTSEIQLQLDDQMITGNYVEINIMLNGDSRIELQSGDVIGYYHPLDSHYNVRDIETDGYFLYRFDGPPPPISVNLSEADHMLNLRQPLIQFVIGM